MVKQKKISNIADRNLAIVKMYQKEKDMLKLQIHSIWAYDKLAALSINTKSMVSWAKRRVAEDLRS